MNKEQLLEFITDVENARRASKKTDYSELMRVGRAHALDRLCGMPLRDQRRLHKMLEEFDEPEHLTEASNDLFCALIHLQIVHARARGELY